jgi:hypothetical protein
MQTRLVLLLAAFLLSTLPTLAQTFEPGFLVRSSGDTLRGEIENGYWVEPPSFIRFRRTAGSPSEVYKPRQLRAAGFTNGRYFQYEALPIDHAASTELADVISSNQSEVHIDSLLAEVLLDGPATLWRVVRPHSTHFLLRRPSQPILDLCERTYIHQTAAGSRQQVDGNNYRSQLEGFFGDCPAAVKTAQTASFTATGIAAVVRSFHDDCRAAGPPLRSWLAPASRRHRMALQGGVLAGIRYNYLKDSYAALPATQACADCQLRPFAGLYADLLKPGRTTALYGELSLSTFRNQSWAYFQTNSNVSYYVVNYKGWLATARLGLRFFHPLPHDQQWLLHVGYELNKTIAPSVTSTSGNLASVPESLLRYASPTLLPHLGIGWRARRLTLTLDGQLYMNSDSEGIVSYFVGSNFATRVGVAYRLGHNPDTAAPAETTKR